MVPEAECLALRRRPSPRDDRTARLATIRATTPLSWDVPQTQAHDPASSMQRAPRVLMRVSKIPSAHDGSQVGDGKIDLYLVPIHEAYEHRVMLYERCELVLHHRGASGSENCTSQRQLRL
jgi:hypothetical protein